MSDADKCPQCGTPLPPQGQCPVCHPPPIAPADRPTIYLGSLLDQPPEKIGPYKILQPLGEGGMGSVWMAEQQTPVRRRVALKLIKLGMDSKQVLARFHAEQQALALMDHPNIAKVFDAGVAENGRPYFVMELVRGLPITFATFALLAFKHSRHRPAPGRPSSTKIPNSMRRKVCSN